MLGIDETNRKSILAIEPGTKDNVDAWEAVFGELIKRGLSLLILPDGDAGSGETRAATGPERCVLAGRFIRLVPLDASHADALYGQIEGAANDGLWDYMPDGPFADSAKGMIQMLGGTVTTTFQNPSAPKSKTTTKKK